ncbi:MAG: hypothetical protein QME40_07250, partial [bacterium]|nr:hypothetical protein [bacterium]
MRNLLVLLILLINSIPAQAAEQGTVTVKAALQTLSIQVVGNDIWDIGVVRPGSVITMSNNQKFVVKNDG